MAAAVREVILMRAVPVGVVGRGAGQLHPEKIVVGAPPVAVAVVVAVAVAVAPPPAVVAVVVVAPAVVGRLLMLDRLPMRAVGVAKRAAGQLRPGKHPEKRRPTRRTI